MTDLVVVSLEAWDGVWRRNQHLISRLLTADPDLRVLFVEPPADPIHDARAGRRPRFGVGPSPLADTSPRLWTMRPVKALPRRLDRRADERIARAVVHAATRIGMPHPLLWINDPAAVDVMRLTGWPTIYDMTDDWAAADRAGRERERIVGAEQQLLRDAAEVVACSPELVRRKTPLRASGGIELVPNAVDVAAYRAPQPRPADLPAVAAVYVGTLHTDRLDVELCMDTARTIEGRGTLVLVGPNALGAADTGRLRAAGIVLLGARQHNEVIAYLQHADALIVPHVVSEFTDSLDPIKLYEYAAVGRPVVTTAVAGFRDAGGPHIQVVPASAFPAAVAAAVPAVERFPAGTDADVPSWDDRAAAMRHVIDRMRRN